MKRNIKINIIIVIILILFLPLFVNFIYSIENINIVRLVSDKNIKEYQAKTPKNGPNISIIEIDHNKYLFCDYSYIYLLQKKNNLLEKRKLNIKNITGTYTPTGLYYHNNLVYIANYLGNNILAAEFNEAALSLQIVNDIRHPELISPENVHATDRFIFTANYDGNSLTCFDHAGRLLWKVHVPQCHGVYAGESMIYATSLGERSIYSFTYDGTLINKQGKLGTSLGEYAWPTDIDALSDGNLVVTDAHNGRLTVLSKDLQPLKALGYNGPSDLNFPYGFLLLEDGDSLLADTFNNRFLRLSKNFLLTEILATGDPVPGRTAASPILGEHGNPYIYKDKAQPMQALLAPLIMSTYKIEGGYTGFKAVNVRGKSKKSIVTKNLGNYLYMTFAERMRDSNIIVIYSPQSSHALLIDADTWLFSVVQIETVSGIHTFSGVWFLEDIPDNIQKKWKNMFNSAQHALNLGVNRVQVLNTIYTEGALKTSPLDWLESPEAKSVLYDITYKNDFVDKAYTRAIKKLYDSDYISLLEYVALQYITAAPSAKLGRSK
jgi:hypothetical protein